MPTLTLLRTSGSFEFSGSSSKTHKMVQRLWSIELRQTFLIPRVQQSYRKLYLPAFQRSRGQAARICIHTRSYEWHAPQHGYSPPAHLGPKADVVICSLSLRERCFMFSASCHAQATASGVKRRCPGWLLRIPFRSRNSTCSTIYLRTGRAPSPQVAAKDAHQVLSIA